MESQENMDLENIEYKESGPEDPAPNQNNENETEILVTPINRMDIEIMAASAPIEQGLTSILQAREGDCPSEMTVSYTVDFQHFVQFKVDNQLLSPPVFVNMLPWRLMLTLNEPILGFFLQCNGENTALDWSCNAVVELGLKCTKDCKKTFSRSPFKHLYTSKENDYGYKSFINWSELTDRTNGFVHNNNLTFMAHFLAEVPHGIFWDSRKLTGYVGLKNQGATCYMNSLLQTLYFINQFRRAVYHMPTEADDSNKSVGLSLQRVFHDLQFEDLPVDTKKLTKSFGWETHDSFMQHDAQEFLRVLLDKLETKMKGTCLEGIIPYLFEGKMTSYIKCTNIDYQSTRSETFYDIQLNINNKLNIYESFQSYVASEILEGDNKYDAAENGLQDASKGVIFTSFPPVLHLHLMRFQYDPVTDSCIKYNGRFEFFEVINLDQYLIRSEETPADYVLQAVLVHSGNNQGGHYVVYISPKADGKWFKFDDDVVCECSRNEAIEQNFGGMTEEEFSFQVKCSNAYMLVYIRRSEMENVLGDILEDELSCELVERLDLEEQLECVWRKDRIDAGKSVSIHVILEEYLEAQQKRCLFDLEKIHQRTFKLRQTQTINDMMSEFELAFCVKRSRMRVWSMWTSQFEKFSFFDFQAQANHTMEHILSSQKLWVIFLELASPDVPNVPMPTFDPSTEVLLFFKYYDAKRKLLNYIGCCQQPLKRKIADMIPKVNKLLGFPPDTPLLVFDECSDRNISNLNETIENILHRHHSDLHGYILIFEKMYTDPQSEMPTIVEYLNNMGTQVDVTFCDKQNIESDIRLCMSRRNTYEEMVQAVGARLNIDPSKLQFFIHTLSDKELAIHHTYGGTIKDILNASKLHSNMKKISYQRLPFTITEWEHRHKIHCVWVSYDLRDEYEIIIYPLRADTVQGLLDEAVQHLNVEETSRLRLTKMKNHKILSMVSEETTLEKMLNPDEDLDEQLINCQLRVEILSIEDANLLEDEELVPVAHFNRDIANVFGIPFLIKIKNGETFGSVKQRIRRRLHITEREWESYKAVIVSMGLKVLAEDSAIIDVDVFRFPNGMLLAWFGLDHLCKYGRNISEKPIRIYN